MKSGSPTKYGWPATARLPSPCSAAKGEYAGTELPDLVILDINLPKKNGHEVLRFIKGQEDLKHIPVIMFTTSSSQEDVRSAYKHYANCYIVKPFDSADFINTVIQIENFWFNIVKLPNK